MLGRRLWTEEEVGRLRALYTSGRAFEEIMNAFPERTDSAIRQKASRLGLKRPTISHPLFNSQAVLRCSDGNKAEEDYLFKCGGCGGWIHVNMYDGADDRTVVCHQCNTVLRYVT